MLRELQDRLRIEIAPRVPVRKTRATTTRKRKTQSEDDEEAMRQPDSYIRVPVWVLVLLVTIAGGLILNGTATVYWAATFKQRFDDFKEETYKQKTDHLEATIQELREALEAERAARVADVQLLTERQNDTRLRMAQRGLMSK